MNLCPTCRRNFAGVSDFDSHRVGAHDHVWSVDRPDGRRCRAIDEMLADGWDNGDRGWRHPRRVRERAGKGSYSLQEPQKARSR
jgi:hypothetical protein